MNKISADKWFTLAFFLCCTLVLVVLGYKLFTHQNALATQSTLHSRAISYAGADEWVLLRDQSLIIDDLKITYRGITHGEILLDVTLLQLDPLYAYRKNVPEALARRSVQIGQRLFKVAAVRATYLRLVPLLGHST